MYFRTASLAQALPTQQPQVPLHSTSACSAPLVHAGPARVRYASAATADARPSAFAATVSLALTAPANAQVDLGTPNAMEGASVQTVYWAAEFVLAWRAQVGPLRITAAAAQSGGNFP